MEVMVQLWPALLLLLLLLLLYKYGTRTHGTLERLGIPVIPPYPFVGSVPRPWRTISFMDELKYARRYGRVWGQYEGATPQLFVADVELAKHIFIKDFNHFVDRPNFMDFELGRDMLDVLKGDRWKAVRSALSPSLVSGAKLKGMMATLQQCTEDACRRMEKKVDKDGTVELRNGLYGPLVLDVMAQYSFGMKVPNIDDQENPFVKAASAFGTFSDTESILAGLMSMFPTLTRYMLCKMITPSVKYCMNLLRQAIKERRAASIERPDLVGTLMDAIDNKVPTKEFRELNITEDILLVQGAEMLMAAYDTTGTALTLATYHLVANPDIMRRCSNEVAEAGELTYEVVQKLPLLDAFLRETMRVSPVVTRHFRLCVRDWQCDGVRVPAGTQVIIPVWPYHFDAKVFPDPERFMPDRWLGEQGRTMGQYSWMAFGLGPRACIGMRLALTKSKFVLAHILKNYKISATDKTRLVYNKGIGILTSFKPIYVKFEKIN